MDRTQISNTLNIVFINVYFCVYEIDNDVLIKYNLFKSHKYKILTTVNMNRIYIMTEIIPW